MTLFYLIFICTLLIFPSIVNEFLEVKIYYGNGYMYFPLPSEMLDFTLRILIVKIGIKTKACEVKLILSHYSKRDF